MELEGGPPNAEPEVKAANPLPVGGETAGALVPPSSDPVVTAPFRVAVVRGFGGFPAAVLDALEDRLDPEVVAVDPVIDVMPNDESIEEQIRQLAAIDPDWVVVVAYSEMFARCMDLMARQTWQPKAKISVLGPNLSDPRFRQRMQEQTEGLIDIGVWPDAQMPGTALFLRRLGAANIALTMDTLLANESVFLLQDALERAASLERDAVFSALSNSTYQSAVLPFGITSFDGGQNGAAIAQLLQVQNGVIVPITTIADLRYTPDPEADQVPVETATQDG